MDGWIRLYRDLLDKPIWLLSTPEQKVILITLLMMANHSENEWEWKGEIYNCKPGQFVTSLEKIVQKSGKGVTMQNVRTALVRFEKYEFLTNESTKTGRLVSICNWDTYQNKENDNNNETNKELTKSQQRANKELTTNKNDKNERIYIYSGETPVVLKLHTRCKNYFHEKYEELFGEVYYWEAKDGANLNAAIKKIKFNRDQKKLQVDDDSVFYAFTAFIDSIRDVWILNNYSMSNINSKFNEIVSQAKIIKNGKKETESNIVNI